MVSYKRLLHILIDRDLKLTNVVRDSGVSASVVTKINNNEYIRLDTLEKICIYLNIRVQDAVEFVDD